MDAMLNLIVQLKKVIFVSVLAQGWPSLSELSNVVQDAKIKGLEDLFINLTTGTWPSPFWVCSSDGLTLSI